MANVIGEAFVAIRPDTSGFESKVRSDVSGVGEKVGSDLGDGVSKGAESKFAGLGKSLGSALLAGGAFVLVGQGLKNVLEAGSDLNETISKTEAVFGKAAPEALDFGENASTALLESKQAALEQLSTLGNLFTSLGLGRQKALDMGKGMVQLAADLGSFNNVPTDEALEAIRSGLVGETEPLRRFGVNMNEAALKAEAMALGISNGTDQLDPAQKAQAAYSLILKQTTNAQGDVEKTGGNAAGQVKTLQATFQDLSAEIGQALIPVMNTMLTIIKDVVNWLKQHDDIAKLLAITVGTTLVVAFVAWGASAAAAAFTTLIAMAPVILIIGAVGLALYDGLVLWQRFGDGIKGIINDTIIPAINFFIDGINTIIDGLNSIPFIGLDIPHIGHVGELATGGGSGGGAPSMPAMNPPAPGQYYRQYPRPIGPGLNGYADGGMVSGALGAPQLAIVHGGERVLTPEQQRSWGGGGINVTVTTAERVTDTTRFGIDLMRKLELVSSEFRL